MNKNFDEGLDLIEDIVELLDENPVGDVNVVIAPAYTHLQSATELLYDNEDISVAAQNCHHKEEGAYTGEVSANMLKSIGVDAVIIGHSERREYFSETNEQLANKVNLALDYEMIPIFCCGEVLTERKAEKHFEVVEKQIKESLFHLSAEQFDNVVIAYEPVWAIGTGETASPEQAQEIHAHIREVVRKQYGNDVADKLSILYGGSCKPANSKELFAKPDVDGGLIGGAALKAEDFVAIIHSF